MKYIIGLFILTAASASFAQEATTAPAPAQEATTAPAPLPARIAIPAVGGAEAMIVGARKQNPFSADEMGETVKILPDGNRIVQSWTGKLARSSSGNIYRDITSGRVGDGRPMIFGGAGVAPPEVAGLNAGEKAKLVLMSQIDAEAAAYGRVIGRGEQPAASGVTIVRSAGSDEETRAMVLSKVEAAVAAEGAGSGSSIEAVRIAVPKQPENGKTTTRKESLGTRDFGGVTADGVRLITTFLPGAVGNEREFEVTSETWFSKDLGVLVYSKRTDPRIGETTYQLTNINRTEPDASLFSRGK